MRGNLVTAGSVIAAVSAVGANAADVKPVFKATEIKAPFLEQFTPDWTSRWTISQATKQTPVGDEIMSYVGKWSVEEPEVAKGIEGDEGLVMKSKAAHHAISAVFPEPISALPERKPLVVQYEVKMQKGLECGGAYLKLLTENPGEGIRAGEDFTDKTPFTLMFGPDKCGSTNKVHLIFRHQNPLTGEWEEKHLKNPPSPKIGKQTALYTLIVQPDNTFEILINDEVVTTGSLLTDFDPPVNPSVDINDPEDFKPSNWVDESQIVDVEATKPEDWDETAPATIVDTTATIPEDWLVDEPKVIPDPDAEKPEEWDDEEDGDWVPDMVPNPACEEVSGCGEWESPVISNPAYKGKWSAPLIPNPEYKGVWAPRKIPNPGYYLDEHPADFTPLAGVGFELWTMTEDILFDNIYVGHNSADAKALAKETYHLKRVVEKEVEGIEDDEEADTKLRFQDLAKLKLLQFRNLFNQDPMHAITAMPEVAGALAVGLLTLLGTLLSLFGLIGSSKPTIQVKQTTSAKVEGKKGPAAPLEAASVKEAIALDNAGVATGKETREATKRTAAGKSDL